MTRSLLDMKVAHTAINLCANLSASDKRVAGAILEHFNRQTGRCDPGQLGLATRLGVSQRTVIRATKNLATVKLFAVHRHCGHGRCNAYEPNWLGFRQIVTAWEAKRDRAGRQRMSPFSSTRPRQDCHLNGAKSVTQTYGKNPLKESARDFHPVKANAIDTRFDMRDHKEEIDKLSLKALARKPFAPGTRSADVMRYAAEKRWTDQLRVRLTRYPESFVAIHDVLTEDIQRAATDAEIKRRGAGLELILRHGSIAVMNLAGCSIQLSAEALRAIGTRRGSIHEDDEGLS